jgi:hypothetical protein
MDKAQRDIADLEQVVVALIAGKMKHAHCTLTISRSLAPADRWFWCVTMPDGHPFDISDRKVGHSLEACIEDMRTAGAESLRRADELWRTRDTLRAESSPP